MKPNIVCKLQKNKAIGTQEGLKDTFNWIVDCVQNIKGGNGIKVEGISEGRIKIELEKENDDSSTGGINFVSAPDSNVVFTKLDNGDMQIGVYYL